LINRKKANVCNVLRLFSIYFFIVQLSLMMTEAYYQFHRFFYVFKRDIKVHRYIIAAWVFPGILIFGIYAPLMYYDPPFGGLDICWILLARYKYNYIYLAPTFLILLFNILIAVYLMRLIITKLKSDPSPDVTKAKKATRGFIVLLFLLGGGYLVTIYGPNVLYYRIFQHTVQGTQGIVVCFLQVFFSKQLVTSIKNKLRPYFTRKSFNRDNTKMKSKYADSPRNKPAIFYEKNVEARNYGGLRIPNGSTDSSLESIPAAINGNTNVAFVDDFNIHSTKPTSTDDHQKERDNQKSEVFVENHEEQPNNSVFEKIVEEEEEEITFKVISHTSAESIVINNTVSDKESSANSNISESFDELAESATSPSEGVKESAISSSEGEKGDSEDNLTRYRNDENVKNFVKDNCESTMSRSINTTNDDTDEAIVVSESKKSRSINTTIDVNDDVIDVNSFKNSSYSKEE